MAMRFISKKQVCQKIALSRASLDRYENAGKFPKRIPYGFRVVWDEAEVEDWMTARKADRDRPRDTSH
jgi:predicted DNA-binding transcriptional regulator AlpA